MKLGVAY